MINPFTDNLKSICNKQPLEQKVLINFIPLIKTLAKVGNNLPSLKKLTPLFWYLTDEQIYQLLYLTIPKNSLPPFSKKKEDKEDKISDVILKMSEVLQWSNRELAMHLNILKKVVDEKYWKTQFGLNG